jgi:hypothetical protein
MRTLTAGHGRVWFARAGGLWTARLSAHAFAVVNVAGAFLLQWTLGRNAGEPPFWLFHVAISMNAAGSR